MSYEQHPSKLDYICATSGCDEMADIPGGICHSCETSYQEVVNCPLTKLLDPLLGHSDPQEPPEKAQSRKTRAHRGFCQYHRKIMYRTAVYPSSNVAFLTENGRATQESMVKDACLFMAAVVNEMCLVSRKVGIRTQQGFLLHTWKHFEQLTGLPDWRIKQCFKWVQKRGWLSSKQPRESYTGKDNLQKWRGLASVKRVELKYFEDLGILNKFQDAQQKAKSRLKKQSTDWKMPIKYILTPITLLRRRRKEAVVRKASVNAKPVIATGLDSNPPPIPI
ncbi:hypothetical protein ABS858_05855 [Vibrio neptunius]|uniref:hypothetical protein n=1 Tax=Vibrio neptunius TaxID=170651 RepID=UPI0033145DC5